MNLFHRFFNTQTLHHTTLFFTVAIFHDIFSVDICGVLMVYSPVTVLLQKTILINY